VWISKSCVPANKTGYDIYIYIYIYIYMWKKWREMASLITNRSIPLKIKGSVYESCVRSVMLHDAERHGH